MIEYDPSTMTVLAWEPFTLTCSTCVDPVFMDEDTGTQSRMTMAELDAACRAHWRDAHSDVVPM